MFTVSTSLLTIYESVWELYFENIKFQLYICTMGCYNEESANTVTL